MIGFWFRCCMLPLLVSSLLLVTGCGGCNNKDASDKAAAKKKEEEKKKKEREKPKENFESLNPVVFPGNFPKPIDPDADIKEKEKQARKLLSNRTKPGHWVNVHFPMIANNYNANGKFIATPVEGGGAPSRILGTDFYSYAERPVALAKGQWKNVEASVYLPKRDLSFRSSTIDYKLGGSAGIPQHNIRQPHPLMHPSQFHLVVLTKRPDAFRYLKKIDGVRMPSVESFDSAMASQPFYEVVVSQPEDPLPVSRNAMTWTTIAYLFWDDLSPDELDAQQQQAMLDWLHFGGQIILSGPDCLDKLRNCFLSPYLPASFEGSVNLVQDDFDELNKSWSVPIRGVRQKYRVGDALLGCDWKPHPDANHIEGTGELVIERAVGRGRIVLTKFPLNSKTPTVSWKGFHSFFNGCLLRKPARRFLVRRHDRSVVFEWAVDGASPYDPLLGSTVRFTSRDLPASPSETVEWPALRTVEPQFGGGNSPVSGGFRVPYYENDNSLFDMPFVNRDAKQRNNKDHWHYGGYQHDNQAGVAAWNDFGSISNAARRTLNSNAGIEPPDPSFVIKMLSIYVLVLVPVNWGLFRLIGKVEWAWVAAPLIAIAGAFAVVKMAALDIGFVRSQTQVALLEMYGDYSRGHLSEYSTMYTSLSTRYSVALDNPTTMALPFPTKLPSDTGGFVIDPDKELRGVRHNQTADNRVEDFLIQSNFTGMLHTEMMRESQGTFSLRGTSLANTTDLNLKTAGVLRRTESGNYQLAWIGELAAGASTELTFLPVDEGACYAKWLGDSNFSNVLARKIWEDRFGGKLVISLGELLSVPELGDFANFEPQFRRYLQKSFDDEGRVVLDDSTSVDRETFFAFVETVYRPEGSELNLGGMLVGIKDSLRLGLGEDRLIGFTDQQISKNKLIPQATQLQQLTLVLVHLNRSPLLPAAPDENHWASFINDQEFDFQLEEPEPTIEEE